jgi:hypothetical protein
LRQSKAVVGGNNDYERTASIFRVKRHIFLYSISCIPSWRILRVSTGRNSNGHNLRWPRRDENPEVPWATPQGFGVWERMSRATLICRNYVHITEGTWQSTAMNTRQAGRATSARTRKRRKHIERRNEAWNGWLNVTASRRARWRVSVWFKF